MGLWLLQFTWGSGGKGVVLQVQSPGTPRDPERKPLTGPPGSTGVSNKSSRAGAHPRCMGKIRNVAESLPELAPAWRQHGRSPFPRSLESDSSTRNPYFVQGHPRSVQNCLHVIASACPRCLRPRMNMYLCLCVCFKCVLGVAVIPLWPARMPDKAPPRPHGFRGGFGLSDCLNGYFQ